MKKQIRILYVEDIPADPVPVHHELQKAGLPFRAQRVDSTDAFHRELERKPPDLILSHYGLPRFGGFAARSIATNQCPDVPFVFVTNSRGEAMAIETFENGATSCFSIPRPPEEATCQEFALDVREMQRARAALPGL